MSPKVRLGRSEPEANRVRHWPTHVPHRWTLGTRLGLPIDFWGSGPRPEQY
jgi:hypothetical protein